MSHGEGRPPLVPSESMPLEYANVHRLSDARQRQIAQTPPWRYKLRVGTVWTFAAAAMACGMASWGFSAYWLMGGGAVAGILGFVLSLATAVLVFVGDLIASPDLRNRWFLYAGILAVSSLLFVSGLTVYRR